MLGYKHSGFSVDTSVCIAAHDRAGLERLLRYCARPTFALERLRKAGVELVYRCTKQHSEPAQPKRPAHYFWAVLMARIFEVFPPQCPLCGEQIRIFAFITHSGDIRRILEHLGTEAVDAGLGLLWVNRLAETAERKRAPKSSFTALPLQLWSTGSPAPPSGNGRRKKAQR